MIAPDRGGVATPRDKRSNAANDVPRHVFDVRYEPAGPAGAASWTRAAGGSRRVAPKGARL